MARYRFTGDWETVLHGLSHGVNATLVREDADGDPVDHEQPDESTVVARPGDVITTDEPYLHALMVDLDAPADEPAARPRRPRAPRAPRTPRTTTASTDKGQE